MVEEGNRAATGSACSAAKLPLVTADEGEIFKGDNRNGNAGPAAALSREGTSMYWVLCWGIDSVTSTVSFCDDGTIHTQADLTPVFFLTFAMVAPAPESFMEEGRFTMTTSNSPPSPFSPRFNSACSSVREPSSQMAAMTDR